MVLNVESALTTLITQYPRLGYTKKYLPDFPEPLFDMPIPVLPHKRGDIILSAHSSIPKAEPLHRHNYFLINYIYRGSYEEVIAGADVTLQEHAIYLSQPYVPHCLKSHISENDVILSIRIRKELLFHSLMPVLPKNESLLSFFISPLNMQPGASHTYLLFPEDPFLSPRLGLTIESMIEEYVEMNPGYDTLLDTNLATLLALLSRYYVLHPELFQNNTKAPTLIDAILRYVSDNCATTTLGAVADEFHYHPNYVSTLLQKETGQTFSEIIRDFRLQRACTLLANSSLPIEEIAVLVGYPHTSNFYRTFKKYRLVSPKEYRDDRKSMPAPNQIR